MISSLSVALPVSPRSNPSSASSSVAVSSTSRSTPMRPSPTVPPSKLPSSLARPPTRPPISSSSTSLPSLSVWPCKATSSVSSSPATPPSPPTSPGPSPLSRTTRRRLPSRCTRASARNAATTGFWASLSLPVSPRCREARLSWSLPSRLTPTGCSRSLLWTVLPAERLPSVRTF